MTEQNQIQDQIAVTVALLRERLGVRGKSLRQALRRAKHRLPRRIYRRAMDLARIEAMVDHPKLRLTLDSPHLLSAAREAGKAMLDRSYNVAAEGESLAQPTLGHRNHTSSCS